MPSLVITIKRDDTTKEWFIPSVDNFDKYFSQEEIDNILMPYYNTIHSLPGLLSVTPIQVDDYTRTVTYELDTKENLQGLLNFLHRPDSQLSRDRQILVGIKRAELELPPYKYESKINL